MLVFADQGLVIPEDDPIFDDPTAEIQEITEDVTGKMEREALPIILTMLHDYDSRIDSIPVYARTRELLRLRKEITTLAGEAYDHLTKRLDEAASLKAHLEALRGRFQPLFPGVDLKLPSLENVPPMLLEGRTQAEWIARSKEGVAGWIVERYRNNSTPYNAVRESFKHAYEGINRIVETSLLYRQRIGEVLFYQANENLFPFAMFSAIMDHRTSKICRALNGKVYAIDSPGLPIPPLHPRCRSRLVPITI